MCNLISQQFTPPPEIFGAKTDEARGYRSYATGEAATSDADS